MKSIKQIIEKLNECNITVYEYKEGKKLCGYELNTYTDAGVNQIVFIDFRNTEMNPKNSAHFIELYNERVNSIDIDEEVEMNRQDKNYRDTFSLTVAIQDFKGWKANLQGIFTEQPEKVEMKKETSQLIEALQIEVNKMAMLWTDQIYAICQTMDYKGSSNFSYNVDRLNQFVHGLNETKVPEQN